MEFSRLIKRAKEGDEAALAALYRDHVPRVLALIRARLSSSLRRKFDTLDIGHSVYLEVMRDLGEFEDRGERAFRSWLFIKAENKLRSKFRRDLHRRGGRREVTLQPGVADQYLDRISSPLSMASRNEEEEQVHDALARLDRGYRRVVRLRTEDSLSYAEVAGWLDLPSADAARKMYARALLKLRQKMKRA